MAKFIPQQYAKVLFRLMQDVPEKQWELVISTFMTYLKKEQAMKKLPHILKYVEQYAKEADGVQEIEVTSAKPLSKEIVHDIEKTIGKKVETTTRVDETLVGGVVVRTKNTILDGSVKTQLARLKQNMGNS